MEDPDFRTLAMLEAVVSSRSVQGAAKRLGLTPSAVSHGLRRLREQTGDPLVTQTTRGMEPTARGRVIVEAARAAIATLRSSMADRPFDPPTERRRFVVDMADYAASLLAPELARRAVAAGPGITLTMVRLSRQPDLALESDVDLVVGPLSADTDRLRTQRLFTDTFACAVRVDHPHVAEGLSLDDYLGLEHVCVAPLGSRSSMVDAALAELGRARSIRLVTPFFLAALAIARSTDLAVTLPARLLDAYGAAFGLRSLAPSFELPRLAMHQTWHARLDRDAGHAWLRRTLLEIGADLRAPS
jgi:DNA-binding transcriptional LysR family regulator